MDTLKQFRQVQADEDDVDIEEDIEDVEDDLEDQDDEVDAERDDVEEDDVDGDDVEDEDIEGDDVDEKAFLQHSYDSWVRQGDNGTKGDMIETITELKFPNGDLISEDRETLMEVAGILTQIGFSKTIKFLKTCETKDDVLWNQPVFDTARSKVGREIMVYRSEEVGAKTMGKCRFCPSEELAFSIVQLRSGDEAATVFIRCVQCGGRWNQ